MSSKKVIENNVISKLNATFGNKLENLDKLEEIKNAVIERKLDAEAKLEWEAASNKSKSKKVISTIQNCLEEIEDVNKEFESYSKESINYLGSTSAIIKALETFVQKIEVLEVTTEYIRIAQKIENISNELHQSIIDQDDELSVTLYVNLCEVGLSLLECPAIHLVSYLSDVIHHWHNYLKDKFSRVFDELLQAIKWPYVNTSLTLPSPPIETIHKLQLYTEYLLQIQLPEENVKPIITSALLTDFPTLSLPILFLIKPLRKRFMFHFYGNKQTNRADKPEWYMTQILTWIRDHEKFVVNTIQPVINRLAMHHVNARIEFMRGLIQLCVEKLDAELPHLAYDDSLFSHCVDEALGMDKELKLVYAYPNSQPGCLGPLTHAPILQKWLNMEKKYALAKMDSMFTSESAWSTMVSDNDDEKVTECANSFVTLLTTMTERYQPLPQPGHRLQFLDLQLDLLDDFRIRLLQLVNDTYDVTVQSSAILNTVNYIIEVLTEWGEMIHFINLHYFKNKFSHQNEVLDAEDQLEIEAGSVFTETISLYTHLKEDVINTLAEAVSMDVKARSRAYRTDIWHSMPIQKDNISLSLTSSACPMFQILATRLHELEELLAPPIFNTIWKKIAKKLNLYLYEELILENRFNEGGAVQIQYDINRNLLPLFAKYTPKPEVYFTSLKEASTLLALPQSSAILLLDTLDKEDYQLQVEALKELGVRKFNPVQAIMILKLRLDLKLF